MKTKTIGRHKLVNGKNALTRVRRYFPTVERVRDAKRGIFVKVKGIDAKQATKKDPKGCALAHACVRCGYADGAIIGIGTSYLIKGKIATRYTTPVSVSREITSYDRHEDFAPGEYSLSKISPSSRMDRKKVSGPSGKRNPHRHLNEIVHRHHTANIRVVGRKHK